MPLAPWVTRWTIIIGGACLVPVPLSLIALFALPINHPLGRILLWVMGGSALILSVWIAVLAIAALASALGAAGFLKGDS